MLYSPLEQFIIMPINRFGIGVLSFSFDTQFLSLFFTSTIIGMLVIGSIVRKNGVEDFPLFPTSFQVTFEFFYLIVLDMVLSSIADADAQRFFPFVFTIFLYIFCLNLFGLAPYYFTATSHIAFTLSISLSFFIAINVLSFKKLGWEWFNIFLPSGAPLSIATLLVPLEFILYLFRPLSLAIRLFCNMLAGHALLKIIVSFGWDIIVLSNNTLEAYFFIVPMLILPALVVLEFAVAVLQAYVFTILVCLYINDVLNAH